MIKIYKNGSEFHSLIIESTNKKGGAMLHFDQVHQVVRMSVVEGNGKRPNTENPKLIEVNFSDLIEMVRILTEEQSKWQDQ